ncbi:MAG: hypothetical protein AAB305_02815 [Candidatus Zixiibacteriota bacterium]|mgnify:CR=1 FL=1
MNHSLPTDITTLKALDVIIDSFLDRAVAAKSARLKILEGLNQLDDISRGFDPTGKPADKLGDWLSDYSAWKTDPALKAGDRNRIRTALGNIHSQIGHRGVSSPELTKMSAEIERWQASAGKTTRKIVLRRQSEVAEEVTADTITPIKATLSDMIRLLEEKGQSKGHILTVLDDLLKSAELQHNRQALLLSAFVIYYLRQNGYLVEPYVKRLRQAENAQPHTSTENRSDAEPR